MSKTSGFNRTLKVTTGMIDILLYHISFLISFYIRYMGKRPTFNYSAYKSVSPYIMIAFLLVNIFSGVYILYNKKLIDMFSITFITQIMMTVIIMAMIFFGRWFAFPRTVLFINLFISTLMLFFWRSLVMSIYFKKSGMTRIMIVGPEESAKKAAHNLQIPDNRQYQVVAITINNYLENIKKNIEEIDLFYILNMDSTKEETEILSYITSKEKRLFLSAEFENILRINNRIMNINDESLIAVGKFEISPEKDLIKRLVDLIISFILIILTSPIMIVTAILIKLTSEGPILYKQTRITKDQKEFEIYKFRSMYVDAEKLSGPILSQAEDPRVTKVGRYLRSLRVDELPQLFNVLKGDMSLVGPRPERPFFVDQFNKENPYYYLRHKVRAGITGYAQIYGTYTTDFNSKLKFDLLYIKKYNFMLDIQLMFQTVRILFDKFSSRGFEEDVKDKKHKNINIYK